MPHSYSEGMETLVRAPTSLVLSKTRTFEAAGPVRVVANYICT